jgi:uncharacterized protein
MGDETGQAYLPQEEAGGGHPPEEAGMTDNIARTRRGFEAFAQGDLDTIRELMHPDVVWHVPGRSTLAGDYRGIDAVLGYFLQLFERSGGTFKAELVECGEIAPDLVSCLVRLSGNMSAAPIDLTGMMLFKSEAGRMVEVWNFSSDQYAIDESEAVESNVSRTRAGYAAFAAGDLDAIRDLFSPEITWHVGGRSSLAGTYAGIDEVFGYFGQLFERSNGTFKADLIECGEIAPDLVGCLVRITGDMPGGRLDTTVVQTFKEVDGKTVEVRGYAEDAYALDAAMGAAITLPDARTAQEAAPIKA